MNIREKYQLGEYEWQNLLCFVRFLFLGIGLIIFFGVYGSTKLDRINPVEIADIYRKNVWFLEHFPQPILVPIAAIFNLHSFRYMLAPLGAIICVLIYSAYFVQDVYALPSLPPALHYVLSSLFGINYPQLIIDKGEKRVKQGEVNLIEKIGGPGFVIIEPGNAGMFRTLHGPSVAKVSETYFLAPFEAIAQEVNLDEQQGFKETISAMTRDGIQVNIRDVHFRYRIRQEEENGKPVPRTPERPYPFSEDAIRDMTFNLQVQGDGLEQWSSAVERAVSGTISDFISSHTIDYLTAPRTGDFIPRLQLKNQLFVETIKKRLADLGAELLWVDVGHVDIQDESIDELRTNVWSADWAGDAAVVRTYGNAVRQAYQGLGRAEAQADFIMSIAGTLSDANFKDKSPENIRKIILARTAQILEAVHEQKNNR